MRCTAGSLASENGLKIAEFWAISLQVASRSSVLRRPCLLMLFFFDGYCGWALAQSISFMLEVASSLARKKKATGWCCNTLHIAAQQKALSPASRRMSTTDLNANHSGISSPPLKRLRNSVPDSLATFLPCFFATLSCT